MSLANPSGRARDTCSHLGLISFMFMQCSTKILPNNRFLLLVRGGTPRLLNPKSATACVLLAPWYHLSRDDDERQGV